MLNSAFDVIERITSWGYDALIVGGAVRDLVLGLDPHDVDIATNCPLNLVEDYYQAKDIGKSKDFGLIQIHYKGHTFEVANFRTESTYSDGRRPDSIQIAQTYAEDAARRDFTFNALALDVHGTLIDLYGGCSDLARGVLRTVGMPQERFDEDYLRMMRAIRFATRLGLEIECETERCILTHKDKLENLAAERIKDELFKMAGYGGKKFAHAVETMHALGILEVILPEVATLKNCTESKQWHPEAWLFGTGTTFDHTMQALRTSQSDDPLTNVAILLHDIGKGVTHVYDVAREKHTYHGHDQAATPLVDDIALRLKLSIEEKQGILFACTKHMSLYDPYMKPSTITKMATDKNWELLKHVSFADSGAKDGCVQTTEAYFVPHMALLEEKAAKWISNAKPIKIVDGNLVMTLCNLPGGRAVGDIIRAVTEMVMDEGRTEPIPELIMECYRKLPEREAYAQ